MATKKTTRVDSKVAVRAREVLSFAQERASTATDWLDLHNALFGVDGKATRSFASVAERTAFTRTPEYQKVLKLLDRLPTPPSTGETIDLRADSNGAISIQLPRSVHAALVAEAEAEGVSLNQLCLSKLVTQLKVVVARN